MPCTDRCRRFTLNTHCVLMYHSLDSTAMTTPSIVLDVSPYSTFSLTCSVFVNPSTTYTVTYQWTGDNIAQPNLTNTAASATTAGSSSYQCNATVMVPSVLGYVVTSDTTKVTIRGKKQMVLTAYMYTLVHVTQLLGRLVAYSSYAHNIYVENVLS